VNFDPDDIKALETLLWAAGRYPLRFAGGRCDVANPETDENGRIISRDCFDTNPGTFHLALTNQIGLAKRGLIMDASHDYEVWNQPIVQYQYRYFNPNTMDSAADLQGARVSLSQFFNDRFRRYRSPKARSVVGIVLDVSYMTEVSPTHEPVDSVDRDRVTTARYFYDLEIDASDKVIGGEWYTQKHPDFLFVPSPGAQATTEFEDLATGVWMPGAAPPESWSSAGREAGSDGIPLAKIVGMLLKLSQP
jgi:hypothetical protein